MITRFKREPVVAALVVVTLGLIAWQQWGMQRTFVVEGAKHQRVSFGNDTLEGGHSQGQISRTDTSLVLDYEIKPGAPYPFINLRLEIGKDATRGMDLSQFETLRVWLNHSGDASPNTRIFLRNHEPDYYNPDDDVSYRFNEVEYQVAKEGYPATFSRDDFRVASWWVARFDVPVNRARVDLSNVIRIEVQTGTNVTMGQGRIEFVRMEWKGKWVSASALYLGILTMWLLAAIANLVQSMIFYRLELKAKEKSEQSLREINGILEIQNKEFERLSKTDPLTGLFNRAGLRDRLQWAGIQVWEENKAVSLILLDVDHFKKVNDSFGHDVGDKVLVGLSQLLRTQIRDSDVLSRWGGEEFLILCVGTNGVGAQGLAEKLRQAIQSTQLIAESEVTCSFGVTQLGREPLAQCFKRVDQALYKSKDDGRNRVTLY